MAHETPFPSSQPHTGPHTEEDLNLQEILRVTLSHATLIAFVVLACLALALSYAFFWPPTYEGTTTVKVPDTSQSAQSMLKELVPYTGSGDPIETFVEIAKSDNVMSRVIKSLSLASRLEYSGLGPQALLKKLEKRVQIVNVKKSNLLMIQTRSRDAQLSADLANTWANAFIETNLDLSRKGAASKRQFLEDQIRQVKIRLNNPRLRLNEESKADEVMYGQLLANIQEARMAESVDESGIVVVDPAVKPEKPVSPKKSLALILGLLLGVALGLQSAFLVDRWRDRINQEKTLLSVTGLPNYAVIPNFREDYPVGLGPPDTAERFSPKSLILNPVFSNSYYRESFKVLRTNLTLARAGRPLRALTILSPGPGEGKTLVNANLAISLADAGKRTLLVDADLRKSSVWKIFGLENRFEIGLPLALTGQKNWNQMTRPSGVENLDLLPNTVFPPNPAELLNSDAMKKLIEELKDEYDYLVFDSPPVLPVTDSVVLSTLLDGVVIMARFNVTRTSEMSGSLSHLHRVGAQVVGTILNCVPSRRANYGYGYGYGYSPTETAVKKES